MKALRSILLICTAMMLTIGAHANDPNKGKAPATQPAPATNAALERSIAADKARAAQGAPAAKSPATPTHVSQPGPDPKLAPPLRTEPKH